MRLPLGRQDLKKAWRSSVVRWLLLAVAVITTLGWVLELRPLAAVWGPVGSWVGGIAAALGLIFTGIQIRDASEERAAEEVRRRQDALDLKQERVRVEVERREAQARAVAVESLVQEGDSGWTFTYTVSNGGDYPIDNAVLLVAGGGAQTLEELMSQSGAALELVLGTVAQKTAKAGVDPVNLVDEPSFGEMTSYCVLLFTDTWDQHWARAPGLLTRRDLPARTC